MIVVYASSHGWGHCIRISAIVNELWNYPIELVTTCPRYLIDSAMTHRRSAPLTVRSLLTDPGCVQSDPFNIDADQTVATWRKTRAAENDLLQRELERLRTKRVRLVIADISYFGQLVAEQLHVPSVCVATFDWEFIHSDLAARSSELQEILAHVAEVSQRFDYCLVPGAACKPLRIGKKQVRFPWSSRKPQMPKSEMRKKLGLHLYQDSVLMSFGGHALKRVHPSVWEKFDNFQFFVLVPQDELGDAPAPNVHLLSSEEWSKYHADLVNTVDIVFGKLGYGLVSEVLNSKTAFLSVERNGNPEGSVLRDQVKICVPFEEISEEDYIAGNWYMLNSLIERNRATEEFSDIPVDGEVKMADFIRRVLGDRRPMDIDIQKYIPHILVIAVLIYYIFFRK